MNRDEYYMALQANSELYHHGILGQKWHIRRYQNEDGTLTEAGRKRYYANGPYGNPSLTKAGRKVADDEIEKLRKKVQKTGISDDDKAAVEEATRKMKSDDNALHNLEKANRATVEDIYMKLDDDINYGELSKKIIGELSKEFDMSTYGLSEVIGQDCSGTASFLYKLNKASSKKFLTNKTSKMCKDLYNARKRSESSAKLRNKAIADAVLHNVSSELMKDIMTDKLEWSPVVWRAEKVIERYLNGR